VVAMAAVAKLLWAEVERARWINSSRQWGALVKYVDLLNVCCWGRGVLDPVD